ncbi:unnamed protein product [Amoebophrya sp. A120]|nr:unnamed protein product [Amoebophrya sp. A120]|eukprot:GSA120T00003059001.1
MDAPEPAAEMDMSAAHEPSLAATPEAPHELTMLQISNMNGDTQKVKIDPSKVKTVADLCSWEYIAKFFDETQLLPPTHRLLWRKVNVDCDPPSDDDEGESHASHAWDENATFEILEGDGDGDEAPENATDDGGAKLRFLDRSELLADVAEHEILVNGTAAVLSLEFVVDAKSSFPYEELKPRPEEEGTFWWIRWVKTLASMSLNEVRDLVYDQGWEMLEAIWNRMKYWLDQAFRREDNLLDALLPTVLEQSSHRHHERFLRSLSQTIGLWHWTIAIMELPEEEWRKHFSLDREKRFFPQEARERYAKQLCELFLFCRNDKHRRAISSSDVQALTLRAANFTTSEVVGLLFKRNPSPSWPRDDTYRNPVIRAWRGHSIPLGHIIRVVDIRTVLDYFEKRPCPSNIAGKASQIDKFCAELIAACCATERLDVAFYNEFAFHPSNLVNRFALPPWRDLLSKIDLEIIRRHDLICAVKDICEVQKYGCPAHDLTNAMSALSALRVKRDKDIVAFCQETGLAQRLQEYTQRTWPGKDWQDFARYVTGGEAEADKLWEA